MKITSKLLLALIATLSLSTAYADEADIQVTASVLNNCKIISAQDLNFGQLDPANAVNKTAEGTVTFACTKNADYTLSADNGQHYDSAASKRRMNNGDDYLPYALAQASFTGTGQGFSTPNSVDLNAQIQGADYRDLPAVSFADTLHLTLLP